MRQMRYKGICLSAILIVCAALVAAAQDVRPLHLPRVTILPIGEDQVVYQMIGEFVNSGSSNLQYGYLTNVAGLDSAFSSTTPTDETTALFTFVTTATTVQVVAHGPFRVINRVGTTTIYLNNGPSNFSDPASFSQGMPIQVSDFIQQAISNTTTNSFVTSHTNTVRKVWTFELNGESYRLGQVARSFRTNYSGQSNSPGLNPTGWYAGTSTGTRN